ncbi:MAG: hypothetical protein ACOX50_02515 [Patescibacteria group bacterium]
MDREVTGLSKLPSKKVLLAIVVVLVLFYLGLTILLVREYRKNQRKELNYEKAVCSYCSVDPCLYSV